MDCTGTSRPGAGSGLPAEAVDEALKLPARDAKAALANQMVRRLHGDAAAESAETDFDRKCRQRTLPEEIPEKTIKSADPTDALVETGLARSRGDARRLLDQGGVRVNAQKVDGTVDLKDGDVLQVGKRNFVRVRLA